VSRRRAADASRERRRRLHPLIYALSYLALPAFGYSLAARIPSFWPRLGFAFIAGALLLTIEATLFTIIGFPWAVTSLSVALVIASVLCRPARERRAAAVASPTAAVTRAGLSFTLAVIAFLHLLLAILTTQAVSPDYLLFWGPKTVHFALARKLDAAYLLSQYAPPRIDYPPLVNVFQAWGLLFTHSMPWTTAAAMSAIWLLAAVPIIRWLLGSWEATAFWTAAMAASLAFSGSGGNGEAMLVVYLSVGAAAIVADQTLIAAVCFAGAALTKEEAFVTIGAVLIGVVLRDRGIKRALILGASTALGAGVWLLFQKRFAMPVGYERFAVKSAIHFENLPTIFREMPKSLAAGCWGLSWLIPLAIVIVVACKSPRSLRDAVPLLVPVPLLFGFFVWVYLQYESALAMKMWWILPRLSQPALSLLILGAAVASLPPRAAA
jgi:hypothetical protein